MTPPSLTTADTARIRADVVHLAWPAALQGLVATVVFFTDRLLVGHYTTEAMGAMGLAGAIMWSVFSVFSAYGAGIVAVVGRAIGAGDIERARATVRVMLRFAGLVGAAVGGLLLLLREPIIELMAGGAHSSESMLAQASDYMAFVCLVTPLEFAAVAGSRSLQASGDTRTPLIVAGITGVVNLIISWVLIYGYLGFPELGVRGAAIGTACAFSLQFALTLGWLRYGAKTLSLGRRLVSSMSWRDALMPVMRVSYRAFGERVLFHSAYVTFTGLIGHLGDLSMAAHHALLGIESISFIAADGLGVAAGALVAQKMGANRPEDAQLAGRIAARLGAIALGCVGVLFALVPEFFVGLLSDDPEVISLGAMCLRVAAIAQPIMAITDAFSGGLRGAGDTTSPMWAAFFGPVIIRTSACYLLAYPLGLGLLGIWIGSTMDWVVRCLWVSRAFLRGRWQSIQV